MTVKGQDELLRTRTSCAYLCLPKDAEPDTEKAPSLVETFLPGIRILQTDISDKRVLFELH